MRALRQSTAVTHSAIMLVVAAAVVVEVAARGMFDILLAYSLFLSCNYTSFST